MDKFYSMLKADQKTFHFPKKYFIAMGERHNRDGLGKQERTTAETDEVLVVEEVGDRPTKGARKMKH